MQNMQVISVIFVLIFVHAVAFRSLGLRTPKTNKIVTSNRHKLR